MANRIPRNFWNGCSEKEVLIAISHEMERPLLMLKGYGTLLLKADISKEEGERALKQVIDHVEFLESLKVSLDEYLRGGSAL